jgi:hypothetical protein
MGSPQSNISVFGNSGIRRRGSNWTITSNSSRLIESGNILKVGALGLIMVLYMSASASSDFSFHFGACLIAATSVTLIIGLYRYQFAVAPRRQKDIPHGYGLSNRYDIIIPHETSGDYIRAGGRYSMLYL